MTELKIAIACVLAAACGGSSKHPGPDGAAGPSTAAVVGTMTAV